MTSKQPHPSFPDVPPLIVTVPGFSNKVWVFSRPLARRRGWVERLNREVNEISASAELRGLLEPDGMVPLAVSPASFAARVKQELAQWKQIASSRKIAVE